MSLESIKRNRERSRIYQNKIRLKNPKEYYKKVFWRVLKWRKNNPEKIKAQRIIFVEKRAGRIKSIPCFCGKEKTETHHKDYSKPFEILWFCKKHHRQADRDELSYPQDDPLTPSLENV